MLFVWECRYNCGLTVNALSWIRVIEDSKVYSESTTFFLVPVVGDPIKIWLDHIEFAERLVEYELGPSDGASHPLQGLDACHEDDDLWGIGIDMHGLADEQAPLQRCTE